MIPFHVALGLYPDLDSYRKREAIADGEGGTEHYHSLLRYFDTISNSIEISNSERAHSQVDVLG
jgi:hypothetical protein